MPAASSSVAPGTAVYVLLMQDSGQTVPVFGLFVAAHDVSGAVIAVSQESVSALGTAFSEGHTPVCVVDD